MSLTIDEINELQAENKRLKAEGELFQVQSNQIQVELSHTFRDYDKAQSRVKALEEASRGVIEALLSHTSGGDYGMVFDEADAYVERQRKGHWKVDEGAIEALKVALAAPAREGDADV